MRTAKEDLKKLEKNISRAVRKVMNRSLGGYVIMCWTHVSQFESDARPDDVRIVKTFSHAIDIENAWDLKYSQGRCVILISTKKINV